VAIADVYDALSNRRCYKEAWDPAAVTEELKKDAGTVFDPELMEVFLDSIDAIRQIGAQFPDASDAHD
jgi:HD-GYP domain-containing protein (c-di-GMP phosphodiesterase class II)